MVFYFTSTEGYTIYMGKDKFENEDLIRYGVLEDIWFHVDNLSSAHVYVRLPNVSRVVISHSHLTNTNLGSYKAG